LEKRKFLTLPRLELRPLGRPARSQSLYRLSYSGMLRALHIAEFPTCNGPSEGVFLSTQLRQGRGQ
jgi:hypothetical protein